MTPWYQAYFFPRPTSRSKPKTTSRTKTKSTRPAGKAPMPCYKIDEHSFGRKSAKAILKQRTSRMSFSQPKVTSSSLVSYTLQSPRSDCPSGLRGYTQVVMHVRAREFKSHIRYTTRNLKFTRVSNRAFKLVEGVLFREKHDK